MSVVSSRSILRLGVAGLLVSGALAASFTQPAVAASHPGGGSSASPASYDDNGNECGPTSLPSPTSHSDNRAPVANDDDLSLINGSGGLVDVTANDTDADNDTLTVLSAGGARYGELCVIDNQVEYYMEEPARGATSDSFTYAITDGEYYRTATVHVTFDTIASQLPVVTRTLKTKHGTVTTKAKIAFTNPDTTYRVEVDYQYRKGHRYYVAGFTLAPGATRTITTARARLDFATIWGNDDEDQYALVNAGVIHTTSGKVVDESDDYFATSTGRRAFATQARHRR